MGIIEAMKLMNEIEVRGALRADARGGRGGRAWCGILGSWSHPNPIDGEGESRAGQLE